MKKTTKGQINEFTLTWVLVYVESTGNSTNLSDSMVSTAVVKGDNLKN